MSLHRQASGAEELMLQREASDSDVHSEPYAQLVTSRAAIYASQMSQDVHPPENAPTAAQEPRENVADGTMTLMLDSAKSALYTAVDTAVCLVSGRPLVDETTDETGAGGGCRRRTGTASFDAHYIQPLSWLHQVRMNFSSCTKCGAAFVPTQQHLLSPSKWGMSRRHHCRACGTSLCAACSSKRLVLDVANQSEIVCDSCYERLKESPVTALEHEKRKEKALHAEEQLQRDAAALVAEQAKMQLIERAEEHRAAAVEKLEALRQEHEQRQGQLVRLLSEKQEESDELLAELDAVRTAAAVAAELQLDKQLAWKQAECDGLVARMQAAKREWDKQREAWMRSEREWEQVAAADMNKLEQELAEAELRERALKDETFDKARELQLQAAEAKHREGVLQAEVEAERHRVQEAAGAAAERSRLEKELAEAERRLQLHAAEAKQKEGILRAEVEAERQRVREVTGGFDYETWRKFNAEKEKRLNDELQNECEICMEEGGNHADWCEKADGSPPE